MRKNSILRNAIAKIREITYDCHPTCNLKEISCISIGNLPTATTKPHSAPSAAPSPKHSEAAACTPVFRGGGVIHSPNSGLPSTIGSIHSTTTEYVHDHFFLVDEAAGQETEIALTDWRFPARAGNDAAFCWLVPQGKNRGHYVYGVNYDHNHKQFQKSKLPRFNLLYTPGFAILRNTAILIFTLLCGYLSWNDPLFKHEQFDLTDAIHFLILLTIYPVGAYFLITAITQKLFAEKINDGIAAEQRMREEIRQLCEQTIANNGKGA